MIIYCIALTIFPDSAASIYAEDFEDDCSDDDDILSEEDFPSEESGESAEENSEVL